MDWDPAEDVIEWVQLPLDLEVLLVCWCCGDAEVETEVNGHQVCYPCAYHLAN